MLRWRALAGLMGLSLIAGVGAAANHAATAGQTTTRHQDPPGTAAKVLDIYYTAPVLVRLGEPVAVPVNVVCATEAGNPCSSRVTLATQEAGRAWEYTSVAADAHLRFDVTNPSARAVGSGRTGTVAFSIRAVGPAGRSVSIPAVGPGLRYYVTRDMPVVTLPAIPFGRVRRGTTVLALPWGSGPMRAGLAIGREAPTAGPSSFDVDRSGRVVLMDPEQRRLAVFSGGRLVRQTMVAVGGRPDVAVTGDGRAWVLGSAGRSLGVQPVGRDGTLGSTIDLGPGVESEIRASGRTPEVEMLPMDAWMPASPAAAFASAAPSVGMPLAGGEHLLRVGSEDRVRLGLASGSSVHDAVELRSTQRFGEMALAQPFGPHGYVVVVHVWRSGLDAADQYQVVRLAGGRVTETFDVANPHFAEAAPLSRFRLGPDGALYQLTTSSSGMRIVRYSLKEGS
jgi:hypothetical protein